MTKKRRYWGCTPARSPRGGECSELSLDHSKTLAPPTPTEIPIYLPALYPTAMRVAIAEGLATHPICSEQWVFDAQRVVHGAQIAKAFYV